MAEFVRKPPSKKQKSINDAIAAKEAAVVAVYDAVSTVIVQFKSQDGDQPAGPQLEMPLTATTEQLQGLLNQLLGNVPLPHPLF